MASTTKKKKSQGSGKPSRRAKKKVTAASTADKLELYQRSVNSPDTDVDFLMRVYEERRGTEPLHLREDFCGTANLSAEWISRSDDHTAEGFDIDPEPVEWGKERNFAPLGDAAERMDFVMKDAREPSVNSPDVRTAANFSYWMFTTRREMLGYFKGAHADLAEGGVFVIDLYGGPEAITEMEEERDIGEGATYVWDQHEYWPGSGEYKCFIHFRFDDGSEMKRAFEYNWRFWNLVELKEILIDAGFQTADAYFEGTDDDNEEEGNGEFDMDERGENCEAWLGYLVAAK
ncbi:MAG: hypothetical protein ACI841_002920 [Planctomycetota bacterium]|jgi:hypothetical protein